MESTAMPPRPRSRAILIRLAVVACAIAVGLQLQAVLSERLAEITARAEQDVVAARAELAFLMRAVFFPVLALTAAIGVILMRSARIALREGRFPPAKSRLWRADVRVVIGAPARQRARVALGLGLALVLCSLAAAGLVGWITRVLLLCRA